MMKLKLYQSVSELPTRSGQISLPFSFYWDFGRKPITDRLYGTVVLEFLIWNLTISIREDY